jgi:2-dehydropantoate 2-reductase
MEVLVMGMGGVGGYFGGLLGRAGHRITAIARGPHLEVLQSTGLRVETVVEDDFTVAVHALPTPEPGHVADLIIMAVKSYDLEDAVHRIRPAVGPNTTILTLLNGVESGETLAAVYGPERILDGVVYIESFIKAPGVVAQIGGPRRAVFGNRNGANGAREQHLLDEFTAAGWNVELADNAIGALWTKFAYLGPNAAFNTITGLNSSQLCQSGDCMGLMRAMVDEYIAVGNAEGAKLPDTLVDGLVERFQNPIIGITSMRRDRVAGKRIEVDALVTSVIRRGKAAGIPTPVTETLNALLQPMAAGGTPAVAGD